MADAPKTDDTQKAATTGPSKPPTAPSPAVNLGGIDAAAIIDNANPPPIFEGRVGRQFIIRGKGFGERLPSEVHQTLVAVEVNGSLVQVTRWRDDSIKGMLPPQMKAGPATAKVTPAQGGEPIVVTGRIS